MAEEKTLEMLGWERAFKAHEAISKAIHLAADEGAYEAFEWLGDYMDGCDAVGEEDEEAYIRWLERLARDFPHDERITEHLDRIFEP